MRLSWRDRIEVSVTNSCDYGGAENVDGDEATWAGKNVEQSDDHKGNAVLEVVSVGSEKCLLHNNLLDADQTSLPSNSLDIGITKLCAAFLCFLIIQKLCILRIRYNLGNYKT